MYNEYFGFTQHPFRLTPDCDMLFASEGHRRAAAYLEYGVHCSEGFVLLSGDIGAGKTTLVRRLLRNMDPNELTAVNLVSSQIEGNDLLWYLAKALQIDAEAGDSSSVLALIETHLYELHDRGQRALLVIDEAQNLSRNAIESLRMISNFQVGPQSLLQILLVGQPELRRLMATSDMDQVRQRVIASCHLGPLTLAETIGYIRHRLERSGWGGRPTFLKDVLIRIHEFSGGIPRRINLTCDRLLLNCYLSKSDLIDPTAAALVLDEILTEIGPIGGGSVSAAADGHPRGGPRSNVVAIDDGRLLQRIAGLEERIDSLATMQQSLVESVTQLSHGERNSLQKEIGPS